MSAKLKNDDAVSLTEIGTIYYTVGGKDFTKQGTKIEAGLLSLSTVGQFTVYRAVWQSNFGKVRTRVYTMGKLSK